jgi:hypothetical protein
MPRDYISVAIVRPGGGLIPDGTGGYLSPGTPVAVSGSPFQCRLYRVPQVTVGRDPKPGAMATIDKVQVLSFVNIAAPIRIGDVATLPDGSKATIIRIRHYKRTLQCDLQTGNV